MKKKKIDTPENKNLVLATHKIQIARQYTHTHPPNVAVVNSLYKTWVCSEHFCDVRHVWFWSAF